MSGIKNLIAHYDFDIEAAKNALKNGTVPNCLKNRKPQPNETRNHRSTLRTGAGEQSPVR